MSVLRLHVCTLRISVFSQTLQVTNIQQCQEQSETKTNLRILTEIFFFRYTVQLAAKTQQSHQSPFSKPLYITTTSSKPHIPKIQSISTDYSGSVLIAFDYPCPYTGPTKFKIKVECQIDNDCDSDHLDEVDFSIREGEIKVVTKIAIFLS